MGRVRVRCPKCHRIFTRKCNFTNHRKLLPGSRGYCGVEQTAEPIPVFEVPPTEAGSATTLNVTNNNLNIVINNYLIPVGSDEEVAYVVEHREELIPKLLAVRGGYRMLPAQYSKVVWCNPAHTSTGSVVMKNSRRNTVLVAFGDGAEVLETHEELTYLVTLAKRQTDRVFHDVMHTENSEELQRELDKYAAWKQREPRGDVRTVQDNLAKMLNVLTAENPEYRAKKRLALMRS